MSFSALALTLALLPSAPPRIAFGTFEGPTASEVETATLRALARRTEVRVIGRTELDAANDPAALDRFGVAVLINGAVTRTSGRWVARLSVRYRAQPQRIAASHRFSATNIGTLPRVVENRLWTALGAALLAAPPPPRDRTILLTSMQGPSGAKRRVIADLRRTHRLEVKSTRGSGPVVPSAAVAERMGVDAFVELSLARRRGRWRASLTVIGPDGKMAQVEASGRRTKQLVAELRPALARAIDEVQPDLPPPPPNPPPASAEARLPPSARSTARADRAKPGSSGSRVGIRMAAGVEVFGRDYSYNDDLFGGLRPYSLDLGPMPWLQLTWSPLSPTDRVVFEVEARGAASVGLNSADGEGNDFGTQALQIHTGVRGGVRFSPFTLEAEAAFGLDSFTFGDADGLDPDLPDADYMFARFGLAGSYRVGILRLRLGAGYRLLVDQGEIATEDWFPNASVSGIDARLDTELALTQQFALTANFGLERYFASLSPEPGDFPVAGGFVDQRWRAGLGISYQL